MSTPPNVKAFSVSVPGTELEDVKDANLASSQSDGSRDSGLSDYMPILLVLIALMLLLMVVR